MPIITPSSGGGGSGATTQVFDSLLSGSAASFDVSGIASSFSHLMIIGYLRSDTAAVSTGCLLRLNNDSAANYDEERLQAIQAAPTSAEGLGGTGITIAVIPAASATAAYFGALWMMIPAYTNATGNKPTVAPFWLATGNTTGLEQVGIAGGKWRTTATAINRITVLPGAGNFVTGSRLSVYGLL